MNGALMGFNAAAVVLTLAGGSVMFLREFFSKLWLRRLFSFRSGILLAVAFSEILPHAWKADPHTAGWGALVGFALLFAMENLAMGDSCPEYLESCSVHLIGWTALTALFAHSLIDGFNLTVAFSAGTLAGAAIGVSLALHKFVDGFTLTSLLGEGGYTRRASFTALVLIAAATPLGSVLALWNIDAFSPRVMAGLLGFAAGSFVYIGAADANLRLHKTHDRTSLVLFAAGLLAVVLFGGMH